jgi:hypothetical protein
MRHVGSGFVKSRRLLGEDKTMKRRFVQVLLFFLIVTAGAAVTYVFSEAQTPPRCQECS